MATDSEILAKMLLSSHQPHPLHTLCITPHHYHLQVLLLSTKHTYTVRFSESVFFFLFFSLSSFAPERGGLATRPLGKTTSGGTLKRGNAKPVPDKQVLSSI